MTPDEFRRAGHALIDWIADYRTTIAQRPVRAATRPGEVRRALPAHPAQDTGSLPELLADLERIVLENISHVQHPRHFGWFPSNATLESVLGDLASSGIGALGISWESAPALTEVEEVVCDWMRELTGLGAPWRGTIFDTASSGALVALIAARERATELRAMQAGLAQESAPLAVYASREAHSSVKKAAVLAGFGADAVRPIACDDTFAMRPERLAAVIAADLERGVRPAAVVATVGTTATTAVDPLPAIAPIVRKAGAWLHVDAALAGSAMLLPECRHLWQGIEAADSLAWNPHKWLGTVLDCSLFYVRDPEHLIRVMSTNPSYLQSAADGEAVQYRDWGIPLGRRFRALKLWFQLRLEGLDAIRARLRRDLANAAWLAEQIALTPEWELVAPRTLQTVCMLHRPPGMKPNALDEHTRQWMEAINASGQALLTGAEVDGRWIARVSIGSLPTERVDVEALWSLMQRAASSG